MDELRQGVDYGPEEDEYGLPWEDFIEDNIQETPETPEIPPEELPPEGTEPEAIPPESEAIPPESGEASVGGYQAGDVDTLNGEQLPIAETYDDINQLIRDSLGQYVIKFDYTTRHGIFTPDRIVEPHRTFVASTGNNILLTYDRTVGDIRGFIIGNIKPGGVLYENTFEIKPEIMRNRPKRRPIVKGKKPRRMVSKRR
ncbi:MAG: hypothetical protein GYA55_09065 [SAR324 cluster bacterium]|uniref:Uncharacterized protein n=1 Tax=SAR324 cluster bacterium TaxID=2024889 RepID=A0A7X9FS89_9DELT|nr:hypothetical protein [SAR324 cluster bacterium]